MTDRDGSSTSSHRGGRPRYRRHSRLGSEDWRRYRLLCRTGRPRSHSPIQSTDTRTCRLHEQRRFTHEAPNHLLPFPLTSRCTFRLQLVARCGGLGRLCGRGSSAKPLFCLTDGVHELISDTSCFASVSGGRKRDFPLEVSEGAGPERRFQSPERVVPQGGRVSMQYPQAILQRWSCCRWRRCGVG